ncbi:2-hydroxychromene-2-carboxylate isomerase [Notoacmeibacter ruber]|uniref:2-hydroxychromene-2-carboxylate isomerase n=1 Tax=Notoacmeibacter ruber TaxID=2670375 RepID=UPI0013145570|nr:2-hydroxychromene-2-carboxylate isomerase [Notoacmeibacter ruber]
MSATVDYYFSSISPFTYLGHETLCTVIDRQNANLRFRPVDLGAINSAPDDRAMQPTELKRRYCLVDLRRVAEMRDVPINLKPAHFPSDPDLADHIVIALTMLDIDPRDFMLRAFQALWTDDKDIADEAQMKAILADLKLPAEEILKLAKTGEATRKRVDYSRKASSLGIEGVPTYVLNGELFFGQDRIEYLESALMSGRAPYTFER